VTASLGTKFEGKFLCPTRDGGQTISRDLLVAFRRILRAQFEWDGPGHFWKLKSQRISKKMIEPSNRY
jgi:hypothetical protein